jgi:ATP-binding cassette subfamily B protein
MAKFRDIIDYYRPYQAIAVFSIAAASIFEIIDLVVPYVIGQILNVLSGQTLDWPVQNAIAVAAELTHMPQNRPLSLAVLLSLIFLLEFRLPHDKMTQGHAR